MHAMHFCGVHVGYRLNSHINAWGLLLYNEMWSDEMGPCKESVVTYKYKFPSVVENYFAYQTIIGQLDSFKYIVYTTFYEELTTIYYNLV